MIPEILSARKVQSPRSAAKKRIHIHVMPRREFSDNESLLEANETQHVKGKISVFMQPLALRIRLVIA